ncbi:Polysaccharide biosynthesis/export protein [Thalassoglobus neptunius]|uniref:Polysaccharide biosynthesis/export protein n=1 Tax=Thalassoglobus neptunius TaxID=1938619 RepID=A0A5C5WIK9_9PLAN|nr:polysaccharide biosynthesis/export family protein [Thalassoglobus neptunius]TWT49935.1 Polysaccharide biosynthesis/export protein [Thalassoglobus neptunius]
MHLGIRLLLLACMVFTGCAHTVKSQPYVTQGIPRELEMMSLPEYRVAPPDVLIIEAIDNIRHPNSLLMPGDTVFLQVAYGLPWEILTQTDSIDEVRAVIDVERSFKDINGNFLIDFEGNVDLGPFYGTVKIAGLSKEDAKQLIKDHLVASNDLAEPKVSLQLIDINAKQPVGGEHLIRPDGTVSLGSYGSVYVSGMTVDEIRHVVEEFLKPHLNQPQVNVDVLAYNSKSYYVITDGGGYGEQVIRLPATGNETVLDAVAQIEGLSQVSSKNIWVARPAPAGMGVAQILPVNWREIAAEGVTATNYQLMPGDRIYIQADRLIKLDNTFAKIISPVERVFGVILLGDSTWDSFYQIGNQGGGF